MAQENKMTEEQIAACKKVLESKDSTSQDMMAALQALKSAGALTEDMQQKYFNEIKSKVVAEKQEAEKDAASVAKHGDVVSDILDNINPLDEKNDKFLEFRQKMDAIRITDENDRELTGEDRQSAIADMIDSAKLSLTKDLLSAPNILESAKDKKEFIESMFIGKLCQAQMQIGIQYEGFLPATADELDSPNGLGDYMKRVEKDYSAAWERFRSASQEKPITTHIGSLASYYANAVSESEAWYEKIIKYSPKAAANEQIAKYKEKISGLDNRIKNNSKYGSWYEKAKSITKALWSNKKSIAINGLLGLGATTALVSGGVVGAGVYVAYTAYSKIGQPIWNEFKKRKMSNPKVGFWDVAKDCGKMLFQKQTDAKNKALKAKLWGGIAAAGLGGALGIGGAIAGVGALGQGVATAATKMTVSGLGAAGSITGAAITINENKKLLKSQDERVNKVDAKAEVNKAWFEIAGATLGLGLSAYFNGSKIIDEMGGLDSVSSVETGASQEVPSKLTEQADSINASDKPAVVDNSVVDDSVAQGNVPTEYDLPTQYDPETMKGISARQFKTLFGNPEEQFIGGTAKLEDAYNAAKNLSPEHLSALGMRSPEELVYKFSRLDFFLGHNKDGSLCIPQFTEPKLKLENLLNCGELVQEGGKVSPNDLAGMKDLLAHINDKGQYQGPGDHYITNNVPNNGDLRGCEETNVPHYKPGGKVPVAEPKPESEFKPLEGKIKPLGIKHENPVIDVNPGGTTWGEETPHTTIVNLGEQVENGHWGKQKYLITQVVEASQKTGVINGENVVNISGKLPDGTRFSETTFSDGHKVFGVAKPGEDWNITEVPAGKEGIINSNADEYLKVRDGFRSSSTVDGLTDVKENGHNGTALLGKKVVLNDTDGSKIIRQGDVNYRLKDGENVQMTGDEKDMTKKSTLINTKKAAEGHNAGKSVVEDGNKSTKDETRLDTFKRIHKPASGISPQDLICMHSKTR